MECVTMNNSKECPVIGIGTFMLSPDDAHNSVKEALKMGYRLVDTAAAYVNERAVGRGIKENGVREDPSGLLYEIIDDADGDKPGAADSVCIHYDAFRIDGRQFASVTDTLELGSLEEGLRIGLRHTPEGATYKYYIPYYLMYNASSKTFKYNNDTVNVSEYSALVYEMRLDSIIFVK